MMLFGRPTFDHLQKRLDTESDDRFFDNMDNSQSSVAPVMDSGMDRSEIMLQGDEPAADIAKSKWTFNEHKKPS